MRNKKHCEGMKCRFFSTDYQVFDLDQSTYDVIPFCSLYEVELCVDYNRRVVYADERCQISPTNLSPKANEIFQVLVSALVEAVQIVDTREDAKDAAKDDTRDVT